MVVQRAMSALPTAILISSLAMFGARASREAESLILRQQFMVVNRRAWTRVRLRNIERLVLAWLYRLFPSVADAIVIVKPATVLRWHREGFRAY